MKTPVMQRASLDPDLRVQLEALRQPDEPLLKIAEASVRCAIMVRARTQFHERGEAAWGNYRRSGIAVSAEVVLDRLKARLDAKRTQLRLTLPITSPTRPPP